MPRRRRGASRMPRRRADWVYRSNARILGTGVNTNDTAGSYDQSVNSLTTGVANAVILSLYDSYNFFAQLTRGGVGSGGAVGSQGVLGRQARAEGRKPLIHAVEGQMFIQPQSWVLGSQMSLGLRLGIFEQDIAGAALLDVAYSMFQPEAAAPGSVPSQFANDSRCNIWERRYFKPFGDSSTTPNINIRIRVRFKRALSAHEMLGMYVEAPSSAGGLASVGLRYQSWLRTLVSDDA